MLNGLSSTFVRNVSFIFSNHSGNPFQLRFGASGQTGQVVRDHAVLEDRFDPVSVKMALPDCLVVKRIQMTLHPSKR